MEEELVRKSYTVVSVSFICICMYTLEDLIGKQKIAAYLNKIDYCMYNIIISYYC